MTPGHPPNNFLLPDRVDEPENHQGGDDETDSDFSDDDIITDPTMPRINPVTSLPGPYVIPWQHFKESPWSKGLIEDGKFNIADTVLLAFVVDLAMKFFIVANISQPDVNLCDSGLVWDILERVFETLLTQLTTHGFSKDNNIASVERFWLYTADDLSKIGERFEIEFLQDVQSPETKILFAEEILYKHYFTDHIDNQNACIAFRWIYGVWPRSVLQTQAEGPETPTHKPISIRQWVFEYN
ncbi:hypothetical protein DDE82_000532 [Stemphylium lycopersici]|nr:hypothetical protein TW65_00796 [Stemphylium lycopersici]RAR11587.1 hypothetical protein DDE82_000532 [Stemphylium lycopersici]